MSDFNALKFVADNAGLNIFKALEKAYEQGKADATQKWTPVSERLPEKDGIYLVSGGGKVWSAQYLTAGCLRGWSNDARNPVVGAWMPLPELKLEEKNDDNFKNSY